MTPTDKQDFFALLADVHDLYGEVCSPQAAELWFSSLRVHSLDAIRGAIDGHLRHPQHGRFAPKPADVMREIESAIPDFMRGAY